HRDGRDHVDAGGRERSGLGRMVITSLFDRHGFAGDVTVAAWADAAADEERSGLRPILGRELVHQFDRLQVDSLQICSGVTKLRAPVRIGTPGRAFKHEAGAVSHSQVRVRSVIGLQLLATLGCVEKDEGREQGKVLALQEDQARLQATIGQEQAPSLIGKAMVKDLHSKIPCVCFSLPMYGRVQLAALAQLISEKAAISSRLLAVRPREL